MVITRGYAIELVRQLLAADFGEDLEAFEGDPVLIRYEDVAEHPSAWEVPFNTKSYLEGGSPATALIPSVAVVPKDPEIHPHFPPTAIPTEKYLAAIQNGERKWVSPPDEVIHYFARVTEDHPREDPVGISRRRIVKGRVIDEDFTRNLKWEPTDYFERYRLGHNEVGHVRITTAEAHQYIRRITEKLSK